VELKTKGVAKTAYRDAGSVAWCLRNIYKADVCLCNYDLHRPD